MARLMLEAFAVSGGVEPRLPEGRRDEVVAVLTRLMVNEELRGAYCAALEAGRRERGLELRLLQAGGGKIYDWEIAERGFESLADDQLADLAVSPEALEALAEALREDPALAEALGGWFFEAGLQDQAARPGDAEQARRLNPRLQALRDRLRNTPDTGPVLSPKIPGPVGLVPAMVGDEVEPGIEKPTARWEAVVTLPDSGRAGGAEGEPGVVRGEVTVEFSWWRDRQPAILEVRLVGAIRLGDADERCVCRLLGAGVSLTAQAEHRKVSFTIADQRFNAAIGSGNLELECEYAREGGAEVRFRVPVRPPEKP